MNILQFEEKDSPNPELTKLFIICIRDVVFYAVKLVILYSFKTADPTHTKLHNMVA